MVVSISDSNLVMVRLDTFWISPSHSKNNSSGEREGGGVEGGGGGGFV